MEQGYIFSYPEIRLLYLREHKRWADHDEITFAAIIKCALCIFLSPSVTVKRVKWKLGRKLDGKQKRSYEHKKSTSCEKNFSSNIDCDCV